MGNDVAKPDGIEDRPLTEAEKARIAAGLRPYIGNGSRPSFADLPPETLAEYQEKRLATVRARREGKKLAELAAYIEAHKDYAATVLGAKMTLIDGLLSEMETVHPETQAVIHDTRLLDDKRMKLLQTMLTEWEKQADLRPSKQSEQTVNVNVSHLVADLKKRLT